MTPEQIYRQLCIIDPALEPRQKCEHLWDFVQGLPDDRIRFHRCQICRKEWIRSMGDLPLFGDGKPRYGSVDELFDLGYRLDIEVAIELWKHCYVADVRPQDGARAATAMGENKVAVLQEALLCAMGGWTE